MSDALDAAIRAAMDEQGCERLVFDSDIPELSSEITCEQHETVWDEVVGACLVIADAVTVGFEAGRRDALSKVNEALDDWINGGDPEDAPKSHMDLLVVRGLARALLSATGEAKPVEICAWCDEPARTSRRHNDGLMHPSCGQLNHGLEASDDD